MWCPSLSSKSVDIFFQIQILIRCVVIFHGLFLNIFKQLKSWAGRLISFQKEASDLALYAIILVKLYLDYQFNSIRILHIREEVYFYIGQHLQGYGFFLKTISCESAGLCNVHLSFILKPVQCLYFCHRFFSLA